MSSSLIFFILTAYAIIACLGDTYTTETGFAKGYGEGNPVARFLQKKLGVSLSAFVTISAFIATATLAFKLKPIAGIIYAAAIAALETYMTIRNYKLVK